MCDTSNKTNIVSKSELEQIYSERQEKATAYCGADGVLLEEEGDGFIRLRAHRIRCKSWFCPVCKHRNLKMLRARVRAMLDGHGAVFLTLTTRDQSQDQIESIKLIQEHWDKMLKRMRRKFGKFKYFKIMEFHKNGQPHLHILLDAYIPQSWLARNWNDVHGAYIVDVRYRDAGRAVNYATKYLSKELSTNATYHALFAITHMRRYSFSRNSVPDDFVVTFFPVSSRQDYYRILMMLLDWQGYELSNPDLIDLDFNDGPEHAEFIAWHWSRDDISTSPENVCVTEQLLLPF